MRLDIMLHLARDVLEQVPLFQHCSPALRNTLLVALKPVTFAPGNHLVREGEVGKSITFLTRGEVEIVAGEEEKVYGTMGPGDYFGYLSLAMKQVSAKQSEQASELLLEGVVL